MKYIKDFFEGARITGIYLCKQKQAAVTKNGKPYENVILQDKTGTIDGKIWRFLCIIYFSNDPSSKNRRAQWN